MITASTKVILRKYKCKIPGCEKVFGGRKAYYSHVCDLTEFRCNYPKCQKVYEKKGMLIAHLNSKHLKKNKKIIENRRCVMCKKSFRSSKTEFKKHCRECPNRGKPITCDICMKTLPTLIGFQTHMLYHKNGALKYEGPTSITDMIVAHGGADGENLCNYCGALCQTAAEYSKHLQNFHKEEVSQVPCPYPECGKMFFSQVSFSCSLILISFQKSEVNRNICSCESTVTSTPCTNAMTTKYVQFVIRPSRISFP
jgi:uncharacterized C2H2 Zn-finger protein